VLMALQVAPTRTRTLARAQARARALPLSRTPTLTRTLTGPAPSATRRRDLDATPVPTYAHYSHGRSQLPGSRAREWAREWPSSHATQQVQHTYQQQTLSRPHSTEPYIGDVRYRTAVHLPCTVPRPDRLTNVRARACSSSCTYYSAYTVSRLFGLFEIRKSSSRGSRAGRSLGSQNQKIKRCREF